MTFKTYSAIFASDLLSLVIVFASTAVEGITMSLIRVWITVTLLTVILTFITSVILKCKI